VEGEEERMAESEYVRVIQLGAATITIVNVWDLEASLTRWFPEPEEGWGTRYAVAYRETKRFPVQCVHIALPRSAVLADASRYEGDAADAIPAYQPPPGLLERLAAAGVRPEETAHVVITHAHSDHYSGTTRERDGRDEPCFGAARVYLGRGDWELPAMQEALRNPDTLESHTLGVLQSQGLLELVEGDRELADGVRIIATPGESPGHQIVRVHSEGQTLYCLGDLYHHELEAEQPAWMVQWADPTTTLASRVALAEAALAEDALLVATHIAGAGRLRRTASGLTWAVA
jgi:glyoxylase-like metal-dependent hydrolase (beta-lactamase superfamily II)